MSKKIYDEDNIFAKILSGSIDCKKVYENDILLAFYDIKPEARIHALVIPKGRYIDFDDFVNNAPSDLQLKFFQGVSYIANNELKLQSGYRIKTNNGRGSGQEVFHFHVHILAA